MSEVTKLPKLYRPIDIIFWSLRDALGSNYGAMHDCDVEVTRKAMRVITGGGWKWQVHHINRIWMWDFTALQDQEIFDNHGMDLEFKIAV